MADTKRDVELRLAATTTGTDQLKALAKQLSDLGKEGSDASPQIERLAQEVERLGATTGALRTFEQLSVELDKTATNLTEAKAKAELLGQAFQEQEAKTNAFRESQAQAKTAVASTEDALRGAKAELNTFKANADNATRATVGYKTELQSLRNNVAALENTLSEQKGLVAKKSEANEVEKALRSLGNQYDAAKESVAKFEQRVQAQGNAAEQAKSELKSLGVEAQTLTAAQEQVQASVVKATQAINAEKQAAEYLQSELRDTARAEQELAAVQGIEKKRQEAIRLQKAAEYVNFWTDALNKAEAAETRLAAESAAAGQALNKAFSTTGIRSAEAIRVEINQIVAALGALKNNASVSGAEFDRAFASAKTRVEALQRELQGLPPRLAETNALTGVLRQSFSQLTAAFGAFEIGRAFITANNQFETLRRTLSLITGSTEAAGAQIQFLRDTANRTGLSVGALTQDFVNFTASANTSGIALDKQREVFGAVATAAGQLGLSTDRVGLILQALSQTANKGKLSLEELQGQLGESLPGALSIVANGFGVTKDRLLELVKGGIDANSFFDAFIRGSKTAFGTGTEQVQSFQAAFNRLRNAFNEFATRASDTAAFRGLVTLIDAAATNFDKLAAAVKFTAEAFVAFKLVEYVKNFGALSSALTKATVEQEANALATKTATTAKVADTAATNANTAATNANTAATNANTTAQAANKLAMGTLAPVLIGVAQAKGEAAKNAGLLATASGALSGSLGLLGRAASGALNLIGGLPGALLLVALNARELGTAIGESAARLVGWGKPIDDVEAKLKAQAEAERQAAEAAKALAAEQRLAEQAALGLSGESAKLVDQFDKVAKESKNSTEALQKLQKELRFDDLSGFTAAGTALSALATQGKLSAEQIKAAFADALKGQDLAVFETNARAAFANIKGGAEQLKIALDAISDESLKRVGTSLQELTSGFSTAANAAINDADRLEVTLKQLGVDAGTAGRLLGQALDKALEAAGTDKAVQSVIDRLTRMGRQGLIAGDQVAAGLDKARQKADQLKVGINSTDEALRELGLKSQKELAATAKKLSEAYAVVANDFSISLTTKVSAFERYREAAIAANGGIESSTVALQRKILEAQLAAKGLSTDIVNGMGSAKRATDAATDAMDRFKDAAGIGPSQDGINFGIRSAGGEVNKVNGLDKIESYGDLIRSTPSGGITRTVGGAQLQPPTSDGKWEFINDAGDTAFQRADSVQHVVPGIGYWRRTDKAPGGPGSLLGTQKVTPTQAPAASTPAAPTPVSSPSRVGPPIPPPATINPDGTTTLTFNFGPGRAYRVTADSYANALALARELEQQFDMQGGEN